MGLYSQSITFGNTFTFAWRKGQCNASMHYKNTWHKNISAYGRCAWHFCKAASTQLYGPGYYGRVFCAAIKANLRNTNSRRVWKIASVQEWSRLQFTSTVNSAQSTRQMFATATCDASCNGFTCRPVTEQVARPRRHWKHFARIFHACCYKAAKETAFNTADNKSGKKKKIQQILHKPKF